MTICPLAVPECFGTCAQISLQQGQTLLMVLRRGLRTFFGSSFVMGFLLPATVTLYPKTGNGPLKPLLRARGAQGHGRGIVSPQAVKSARSSQLWASLGGKKGRPHRSTCYHFALVTNHPHIALALQILQALLTPVIAGIAVYIAWQQWQGNKLKLVLDRYDRRLRVYENVVALLLLVQRDFNPQIVDLQKFRRDTAEADFLFEAEISVYLDEIFKRGVELWSARNEYRDFTQQPPPGYDHNKVVNTMHEQEVWFTNQFGAAKQTFKKYLDVSR
jgi:hypothetical protein